MMKLYKNEKGARDRFYAKTGIAKHREWRGIASTFYDYINWVVNVGILAKFVAKSPVRVIKGIIEYRWMGSYLASLHFVDNCVEGLRGNALKAAHTQLHLIMNGATYYIGEALKGDRRLGDNKYAEKQVLLEQTMAPEIVTGFKNLTPMSFETFQGLLGCYMDQQLPLFYIDTIESYGLPSDSCRLSSTAVGVAINDDFPLNGACLLVNNMPCDSSSMNSQLIDRRVKLPKLLTTMPMRWDDERTDEYAVKKLKKAIDFIAVHTHEEFDRAQFLSVMEKHNMEVQNEMEMNEYLRTPYTPFGVSTGTLFHMFYYAFSGGCFEPVIKAQKKCLKIAERAYKNRTNCFPKTRHRMIFWGGSAAYWFTQPNWLYNCWGIFTVGQMFNFEGNVLIDTSSLDSALLGVAKNYEYGIMRRHLTGGYQHMVEFWDIAEQFNCDMVLMNDDITCKGAMGMAGMINDQCKDHPNIHLMWVPNDLFDHRTVSRNEIRRIVNEYMTTVMNEEPLDATLLDFDDFEGW